MGFQSECGSTAHFIQMFMTDFLSFWWWWHHGCSFCVVEMRAWGRALRILMAFQTILCLVWWSEFIITDFTLCLVFYFIVVYFVPKLRKSAGPLLFLDFHVFILSRRGWSRKLISKKGLGYCFLGEWSMDEHTSSWSTSLLTSIYNLPKSWRGLRRLRSSKG